MSWQPLRDYLRADAERFVDGVMTDPATDARARAYLAVHRQRVVDQMTDKAMSVTVERFLAQREQQTTHRVNGHAKVH